MPLDQLNIVYERRPNCGFIHYCYRPMAQKSVEGGSIKNKLSTSYVAHEGTVLPCVWHRGTMDVCTVLRKAIRIPRSVVHWAYNTKFEDSAVMYLQCLS